ncbi:protein RRP5 homolog [Ischnura elegans]|uniref:protein RRP5 homolog n=1 Tax=Ischnura elegans TaxID=197161 RepID=UPI001ED88C18|nr:protein RRP5 homolog [Ischnura elegans]
MAIIKERCFPRGSKKASAVSTKTKQKIKKVHLFHSGKKKSKSNRNTKKAVDVEQKEHLVAESLSYRSLADGMTLLACVTGVTDYYVRLSLPGRLVGKATIANISSSYSRIMRSLLDKKEVSENYYALKEMFQPGQYVLAKILKVTKFEEKSRYKVELTLDPASINFNYSHSMVKSGMILQGSVKSVEDHGYMIDFGINSLTAFLKSDKATSFISQCNDGRPLGIGQVLLCCMQKVDHTSPGATVAQVSSEPKEVSSSVADLNHEMSINTLSPGTLVKCLVVENISDGLMVEFLNFKGFVHRDHAGDPPPRIAAICHARVLYTVPLLNTVYLSILLGTKDFFASGGFDDKSAPKVGQVMRNAVIKTVSRKGVVIGLGPGGKHKGFISRRKLRDGEEVPPEEVKKLYTSGMNMDVRLIGQDKLEGVFICSAQKKTVNLKYFSVADFEPGVKVTATVVALKEHGVMVEIMDSNRVEGYAPLTQLADFPVKHPEKHFPPGKKVKARVLKVIKDKGNLLLTLKPSLVESELPILDKYQEAENVSIADGTIFKILDSGLVIIFYNGIKGFVQKDDTGISNFDTSGLKEAFFEGQTVRCRVFGFNSHHQRLKLSLVLKTNEDPEMVSWLGSQFTVKVSEVNEGGLVVKVVKACDQEGVTLKRRKGVIPALHLSDCSALSRPLLKTYKPGDVIPSAVLFSVHPADGEDSRNTLVFSLRGSVMEFSQSLKGMTEDVVADDEEQMKTASGSLDEGSVIPCSVSKAVSKGLILDAPIPYGRKMFVPLQMVSDEVLDSIDDQVFTAHKPILGRIMKVDDENKNMLMATKLSELWDAYDLEPSLNIGKSYLSAAGYIRERVEQDGKMPLKKFVEGQRVEGVVKSISSAGNATVEVRRICGEKKEKVKPFVRATVTPYNYRKRPTNVGDKVEGVVIFVDYGEDQLYLTLNDPAMEEVEKAAHETLAIGKCIRAEVLLVVKDIAVALVKGQLLHGELIYLPVRNHCNDFCGSEESESPLLPGDIHKVIVSGKEGGKMIGLLKRKVILAGKYSEGKPIKSNRKRQLENMRAAEKKSSEELSAPATKKRKKVVLDAEGESVVKVEDYLEEGCGGARRPSGSESDVKVAQRGVEYLKRKVMDISEPSDMAGDMLASDERTRWDDKPSALEQLPHLQVDVGFVWDKDILSLPSALAGQQDGSDESSLEDENVNNEVNDKEKKSKKKRSKSESIAQKEKEENAVREAEERLMDPEACPQTADDFDRLVLSSPDSSIVWLKYVAFHLQNTEIEKARAVAQRALKTINFREEQEKFNIWVCMLNLENLYGTKESLEKVLQEALQMNDAMKVYFQMLQIYLDSHKIEELDKLMDAMLKKYKDKKEAWIQAGTVCMKSNRAEKAGEILRRALKSLPKHDHVEVICRWAQLEARSECGSVDRAQSLLEGVLVACPKRTDVWSSLVDVLVGAGRIQDARGVMERAISQSLPLRKMKVLFKKFLSFEEAHGTPEGAARVRQLAIDFVESKVPGSGN